MANAVWVLLIFMRPLDGGLPIYQVEVLNSKAVCEEAALARKASFMATGEYRDGQWTCDLKQVYNAVLPSADPQPSPPRLNVPVDQETFDRMLRLTSRCADWKFELGSWWHEANDRMAVTGITPLAEQKPASDEIDQIDQICSDPTTVAQDSPTLAEDAAAYIERARKIHDDAGGRHIPIE